MLTFGSADTPGPASGDPIPWGRYVFGSVALVVSAFLFVRSPVGRLLGMSPRRTNPRRRNPPLRSRYHGPAPPRFERRNFVFLTFKKDGRWGVGERVYGKPVDPHWFDTEAAARAYARELVHHLGRFGSTVEFRRFADQRVEDRRGIQSRRSRR